MKMPDFASSTLLLLLATVFQGGSAMAGIIAFENPGPGEEGHFDWHWPGRDNPVTFEQWLDITKPSTDQSALENGNSIGQIWAPEEQNQTFGGADVARAGNTTLTRAFSFGEDVSAAVFSTNGLGTHVALVNGNEVVSDFPAGELRYIGVKTENGNFGWIAVVRDRFNFTTTGWAYETEPGVPINAGQVPVGGTAPILGLGLLFRRSRKRGR